MRNFTQKIVTKTGEYIRRISTDPKGKTNTFRLNNTYVTVQYMGFSKYMIGADRWDKNGDYVNGIVINGLTRGGAYTALVMVDNILNKNWVREIKSEYTSLENYLNRTIVSPEYIKEKKKYEKKGGEN